MANTLTNLIPSAYQALDVVSRELTGMIPAVTMDASVARAGIGQTVYSHVAPASTATDITPGVTPPNDGDQVIGSVSLAITKARRVPIRWAGEESQGLNNGGAGVNSIKVNQIAQAIRTLVNEIESDLAGLYNTTSRAYGTAGTTPFATAGDYTDASNTRKIVVDNGIDSDLQLVVDTSAGANMRGKMSTYINNGTDVILRQGVLLDINGMAIRESAQIKTPTSGTGAAYTSSTAGFAIGSTSIAIITGTGTVLAGDTVTFAGDTNKYVVETGVAAPGTIVLVAPGLRKAIAASAVAMTVGATSAKNMLFARSAIILATRMPALPDGGDLAIDRTTIVDPRSGMAFEIAMYPQYRQMQYEISTAWGVANVKRAHTALLLG